MSFSSTLRSVRRFVPVKGLISRNKDSFMRLYCEKPRNMCSSSELSSYAKGSSFPPLTPGKLRLYSMRFCPYAQRTRLVLIHKNIRCETININLKFKPDWFLERNPDGLVPVLEQDDKIIYESLVCNDYLDDVYPEPRLQSTDPYRRARDKMLIGQFDKLLQLLKRTFYGKTSEADHYQAWLSMFKLLEQNLDEEGAFFGGEQVGMLDFNLWPWFERFEALQNLTGNRSFVDKLPRKLSAWRARMFQEPAVRATMFEPDQHRHFFKSLLQGQPDYDAGLNIQSKL